MVPIGAVPSVTGETDLWAALEMLERTGLDALLVVAGAPGALLTRRSAAQLVHQKAEERARQLIARGPGGKGRFFGR
jgi:CBS domain-containing protein